MEVDLGRWTVPMEREESVESDSPAAFIDRHSSCRGYAYSMPKGPDCGLLRELMGKRWILSGKDHLLSQTPPHSRGCTVIRQLPLVVVTMSVKPDAAL